MVTRKRAVEIPLYDWVEGNEGNSFIYVNRKPNKDDPGITRILRGTPEDPFFKLYKKGLLIGKALDDAKVLFGT